MAIARGRTISVTPRPLVLYPDAILQRIASILSTRRPRSKLPARDLPKYRHKLRDAQLEGAKVEWAPRSSDATLLGEAFGWNSLGNLRFRLVN